MFNLNNHQSRLVNKILLFVVFCMIRSIATIGLNEKSTENPRDKLAEAIHGGTVSEERNINIPIHSESSLVNDETKLEKDLESKSNKGEMNLQKQPDTTFEDLEPINNTSVPNNVLLENSTDKIRNTTTIKYSTNEISNEEKLCKSNLIYEMQMMLKTLNISVDVQDINNASIRGIAQKVDEFGVMKLFFMYTVDINHLTNYSGLVGREFSVSSDNVSRLLSAQQNSNESSADNPFINFIDKGSIIRAKLVQETEINRDKNTSKINIGVQIDLQRRTSETEVTTEDNPSAYTRMRNRKKARRKIQNYKPSSIYFGSLLAIVSSVLCGTSFALKKRSLIPKNKECSAELTSHAFLRNKEWWYGHSLMVVGDLLHYVAFNFAPAIVVCTLQMLTVLVAAIASSKLLGEKVNNYGLLAFALCLSGCWVIVFNAPKEPHIYTTDTLIFLLTDPVFLGYLSFMVILSFVLIQCCMPRWGMTNSLVYTLQSAIFGSMIVIGVKGIALGYTDSLKSWVPWVSLTIVGIFLLFQLEYLNRALTIYNALVVTTQFYVMYSAWAILGSSLLFKVWETSSFEMMFVNFCGFLTIALGVLVFTIFQEDNAIFDFSKLFAGPERKTRF